ncbi:MAG TPA: glycosyltransferase family 39 protein [Thermoleophilaceae bacterium]|nr:glycosyltransferase family 39 protein [Thermoleophilaceae bacterium]
MRRFLYPLLLAVPFVAGIAVLKGLTVEIDTFHGSDARIYHLPTIEHFADRLEFESYPAAQTPLYHLLFAGWGELVGFEAWRLRLLNVLISYAAVLVLFGLLRRRGLEAVQSFALSLLFALSPYYFGASFTLLTDNLALLFGLLSLDRLDRFGERARIGDLALGVLAMAAAVLTRQSYLWLALVAVFQLVRAPISMPVRTAGAAATALALAPMAALVVAWGGLVPPGADPASCGLCTDKPGVGRDSITLRTIGFTVALFGLYAAAVFGPALARRARALAAGARAGGGSARELALPILAAIALLAISPLAYKPVEPGRAGDAGYLWKIADRFPELLGSHLIFWVLVPLGAVALFLLARRAGIASLPVVYFAGFLAAALPVGLVYQKYFDPFALLAVALLVTSPDLRERSDYAGIAIGAVAFVAYAVSFAG